MTNFTIYPIENYLAIKTLIGIHRIEKIKKIKIEEEMLLAVATMVLKGGILGAATGDGMKAVTGTATGAAIGIGFLIIENTMDAVIDTVIDIITKFFMEFTLVMIPAVLDSGPFIMAYLIAIITVKIINNIQLSSVAAVEINKTTLEMIENTKLEDEAFEYEMHILTSEFNNVALEIIQENAIL